MRPDGIDETNEPIGCGGPIVTTTTTTSTTSTTLPCDPHPDDVTPAPRQQHAAAEPGAPKGLVRIVDARRARRESDPPPSPGTPGDPTVGGGTLVVYNAAGSPEAVTVALPPTGWTALGSPSSPKGYRYRGSGPIRSVVVRPNRIAVKGGRAAWGYTLDEASQGRVAVRLGLGTERPWCADVPAKVSGNPPSTTANDRVDVFVGAPRTPPPSSCPPEP